MSQDVQADENVRNKKPVVISRIHEGDPNQLYGERYGVDWMYGREFGDAVKQVTLYGSAMARAGWNGKDQFVYYVPPAEYKAQTGVAQAVFGEGNLVPYEGYYAIKNAQGRVSVWVPSTGDLQADDWYIIEQDELFLKYHPTPKKTGSLNYIGDPTLGHTVRTDDPDAGFSGFKDVPLYVGTKTVAASPMTRGEYNAYRGWDLPAYEDGSEQGYLVEYTDGGKSNHKNHAGYISWSPKDVFEKSYNKVESPEEHGGSSTKV